MNIIDRIKRELQDNTDTKREHTKLVFDYVIRHKDVMPRTALRYAIEKMSPELKKQAMAR